MQNINGFGNGAKALQQIKNQQETINKAFQLWTQSLKSPKTIEGSGIHIELVSKEMTKFENALKEIMFPSEPWDYI